MKKVLHIRLDAPTYSSDGIKKGFVENGYEYYGINWQQVRFDEGILGLQSRIILAAKNIEPDLIFLHIQNPGVIDIETCQELTQLGLTVLYTFDVREDIKWMQELAPYLDLILFADMVSVENCKQIGIFNVDVLQSSCDMDFYQPITPHIKYDAEIVFIGSNYLNTNLNFPLAQERLDMVNFLKKEYGDRFMVKGLNWLDGDKPHSEMINPLQERDIYCSAKIAICHNNFDRPFYTSDRLWRSMACGCFTLTKYFKGAELIFAQGHHLNWWRNFDDLKNKIDNHLSLSIDREKIARSGQEYVRTAHTWKRRIQEMQTIIFTHGIKPTNTVS